jgi:hypothetical protein
MPPMTVDDLEQEANDAADKIWRSPAQGHVAYGAYGSEDVAGANLRDRIIAANISGFPSQRPNSDSDWGNYYKSYAELVRREAAHKFAERLNPGTQVSDADLEQAADRWRIGVRAHEKWSPDHLLFPDKSRGHGQAAGSTDGRLLRKLMMAATQAAVTRDPSFASYRTDEDFITARNRLNEAERALQNDPGNAQLQQEHTEAKQELSNQSQRLNTEVASKLDALLSQPGGSLALKKAVFLTQEKLRDPLGYKQKYARLVPFGGKDAAGNDKFVKASRRFYTPANVQLPLPPQDDGSSPTITPVPMTDFSGTLPSFRTSPKALIKSVGQQGLGECWLQASAASLPRKTLKKMFSWSQSHGSDGVTTRLYDENGKPIYIRTPKNQLNHSESAHKAMWPYALESAVAKVGRKAFRDFRKNNGINLRDPNRGIPLYSVRDVYGGTRADAAKLLTGKDPLIDWDVSDVPGFIKTGLILNAFAAAEAAEAASAASEGRNPRKIKGVVSFGDFNNQGMGDHGPGHATTFRGPARDNSSGFFGKIGAFFTREGLFGNTWRNGGSSTNVARGEKMFSAPLSRVRGVSFLDPDGADPTKDRFVSVPSTHNHNSPPERYQEDQTIRIGNLFTRPR